MGGGIIRENDKHLIKLIDELGIKKDEFISEISETKENKDKINKIIEEIKEKYKEQTSSVTEFILRELGYDKYNTFLKLTEFTDFQHQTIKTFIENYPINDLKRESKKYYFTDWKKLLLKLVEPSFKKNKLKLGEIVYKINYDIKKIGTISLNKHKNIYNFDKIIFATTLTSIKELLGENISKNIRSVEFFRVYAKFSSGNPFKNKIVSKTPCHYIIPHNKDICMIVYADSINCKWWKNNTNFEKNKIIALLNYLMPKICDEYEEKTGDKIEKNLIKIEDIIFQYWIDGIHYFFDDKIKSNLFNPRKDVFICGEINSNNQGWTEGAIESVNKLLNL